MIWFSSNEFIKRPTVYNKVKKLKLSFSSIFKSYSYRRRKLKQIYILNSSKLASFDSLLLRNIQQSLQPQMPHGIVLRKYWNKNIQQIYHNYRAIKEQNYAHTEILKHAKIFKNAEMSFVFYIFGLLYII